MDQSKEAAATAPGATATADIKTADLSATPASADALAIEVQRIGAATPGSDAPPAHALPIRTPLLSRSVRMAAAVALAAGLGSFAGALGAVGFYEMKSAPVVAAVPEIDAKEVGARLSAEIATLKAGLENASRGSNAQFARLAERLERAEKAQVEPAAKLARIGETLDRIDRRAATPVPQQQAAAPPPAPDVTGSIPEAQPGKSAVIEGWVIRDVYDGLALIEGRNGRMVEVGRGSMVPGVGRVEAVRRQDGRWVVVTPRGVIVATRR